MWALNPSPTNQGNMSLLVSKAQGPWWRWIEQQRLSSPRSPEAIQLGGCAREGTKVLCTWGGLLRGLKMLSRSVTWEGFSTSKLKAFFIFSILLAGNPIVYVTNVYCTPTMGRVLYQVQEGTENSGETYK